MFTLSRRDLSRIIAAGHAREAEIASEAEMPSDTPARARLITLLNALDGDDLVELVALAWIGRGDFEWSDWAMAMAQARNLISTRPAEYLADLPGFPFYLESALAALGEE